MIYKPVYLDQKLMSTHISRYDQTQVCVAAAAAKSIHR